jgi:hypothetical protein
MKIRHALAALLALSLAACATTPTIKSAPPAPIVAPDPPGLVQILRKPEATITALLGKPSMARTEGPARQLQFIRPPCILDIFLYPTPQSPTPLARTATARKPDGSAMDPGACLTLIVPTAPPAR